MAKKISKKNQAKKDLQKLIEQKLQSLLVILNPQMKEKKFKSRIRRAGKILGRGIKPGLINEETQDQPIMQQEENSIIIIPVGD